METLDQLGSTTTLPGRYAATLFELAQQNNLLNVVQDNFRDFLTTLRTHQELKKFTSSTWISKIEQHQVISALAEKLSFEKTFTTFIKILIDNRRLAHIEEIYTAFDELIDRHNNSVRFTISSAHAMTSSQQKRITSILAKRWGDNVHLEFLTDNKLLAGFVVRTGNQVVDFSVANQLHRLASSMKGHA